MSTIKRSLARLVITSIVSMAAACSSQHATYAPDGRRGYVISCDGSLNSFSSCLVKAGRACGSAGYDTVQGGPDDRSLLIACKAAH
jgi:hypothetical protein